MLLCGGPQETVPEKGELVGQPWVPEEITWSTPDGGQGAVDGMDTSTVPGRTSSM